MNYLYYNNTKSFLEEYNKDFPDALANKYRELFHVSPGLYLYNSWKSSIAYLYNLIKALNSKGIVLEYIIPAGGERADAIFVGNTVSPSLMIIEMKGWRTMEIVDDYSVIADNKKEVNPAYQVLNYSGKIKYSIEGIENFNINSMVILYNILNHNKSMDGIYSGNEQELIIKELKKNLDPGFDPRTLATFVNARYRQNINLFEAVRKYHLDIKNGAMKALASEGYGLYSEQLEPYLEIINDLLTGTPGNYIIHGGPGSGKSLIALNLLLRSSAMGKQSVLSYRNNRMVASLRKLLDSISSGMSTLIKYYSTGRPGNPGVAEDKFPVHYDIAIFDESQRMTVKNIENAGKVADISVFFYDDSQILGTREQGTQSNFLKYLENPHEITLKGLYRNGNEYGEFVNKLLEGVSTIYPEPYDLQYFSDIEGLINALKTKIDHGKKSALVASFTEAKGNIHDINSQDNIRIGNKIPSGFNLYAGTGIEIRWLMDPKKEYAPFWVGGESNKLEKCASVYGAQGFEADYTGVIWGRDLVRRDNKWVLGDNCEDFEIKKLFFKGKNGDKTSYDIAMDLLVNRYRILLTRGIHGTYIFCEDSETGEYLKKQCHVEIGLNDSKFQNGCA